MKRLMLATSVIALSLSGTAFAAGTGTPGAGAPNTATGMSSSQSRTSSATSGVLQSEISRAQAALRDKGLYKGRVDGVMGPKTRQAISQFQRQNGLKQTAQLDSRTMSQLERGSGSGGAAPSNAPSSGMPGASSPGAGSSAPGGTGGMH